MGHFARLQLVGKVTYYLGWLALVAGGLVHINIGKAMFAGMSLTQRNLFEISVVSFLICVASELRAISAPGAEVPAITKRQVAA